MRHGPATAPLRHVQKVWLIKALSSAVLHVDMIVSPDGHVCWIALHAVSRTVPFLFVLIMVDYCSAYV